MKSVEGRKEEKGEEIKEKAIRPFGAEEWREVLVSQTEDSAVLENCVSESKQKRREKYREQEKIVRDTQWVKRKESFFSLLKLYL